MLIRSDMSTTCLIGASEANQLLQPEITCFTHESCLWRSVASHFSFTPASSWQKPLSSSPEPSIRRAANMAWSGNTTGTLGRNGFQKVSLLARDASAYSRHCSERSHFIFWVMAALRQSPNPSVKGTATSGLRPLVAAPYVER
jgi:hypothetical protein